MGADLSAAVVPPRASVQLMSANNSSVCVNGFTPLQLSVEYENAAVERVDQGAAACLSTTAVLRTQYSLPL
jgi:hypothetical protein